MCDAPDDETHFVAGKGQGRVGHNRTWRARQTAMLFVSRSNAPLLWGSFLNARLTRLQIEGVFTIDPPPYCLVRSRECLVGGVLARVGSPEGPVDLVLDTDVDLQTAEDIGLMDRKILQEGLCVQRLSPGLGVEDPVGQGVLIRSVHFQVVVDQIQYLLSQGFGHSGPP